MSLTGPLTLGFAIALCVIVPLLTAATWNRWGHDAARWAATRRWIPRAALLITSQLVAVLLVGVIVNDQGAFYSSWREVIGQEHHHVSRAAARAGAADASLQAKLASSSAQGRGLLVPVRIPGTVSGVGSFAGYVYLPVQYGTPAYANRSFPVVELVAGSPGTPRTWLDGLHLAHVLDSEIGSGRSLPFIAVMPDVAVDGARDTECVNIAGGPRVEDYLVQDVRTFVLREFRADPDRSAWAMMGYSSGGYCAANLVMRNPQKYAAAVSVAGYDAPAHDHQTGDLFGHSVALRDENTPIWRATHLPPPPVALLLLSSDQDPGTTPDAVALAAAARPPLRVTRIALRHGGHNFEVWRSEEPVAFAWLSRQLSAPLAPEPVIDGIQPTGAN